MTLGTSLRKGGNVPVQGTPQNTEAMQRREKNGTGRGGAGTGIKG